MAKYPPSHHAAPDKPLTGGGGRGPHPPEPFGGGGGGGRGDNDDTSRYIDRLRKYRIGLYLASASILMLFFGFTTLFFARRHAGRYDPFTNAFVTEWISIKLPWMWLAINTVVLGISSVVAEFARRASALEVVLIPVSSIPGVARIPERSLTFIRVTIGFGILFLAGQWMAWSQLREAIHPELATVSGSFVYILTGAHALHLLGGLVVASYVAFTRRSIEARRIAIDVTTWYWHFMGAMWLYVLIVLWALQ